MDQKYHDCLIGWLKQKGVDRPLHAAFVVDVKQYTSQVFPVEFMLCDARLE